MRPEPMDDRPFFRPEAERYRRQRHLGEIILFRPLSLRLVALYPLVVLGLLVLGASQIHLQDRHVAVAELPATAERVYIVVTAPTAVELTVGDGIDLRVRVSDSGTAVSLHGRVEVIEAIECGAEARALMAARLGATPRQCARLAIAFAREDAPELLEADAGTRTVDLWTPPVDYLSSLLDG